MFHFSTLFSAATVAASFDAAIERDAANGRVNSEFSSMLALHYGLELPAAPAQVLKTINQFLTLEKAPKLAHGPGARAHAPAVGQALHALGVALHDAGKVKNLPALAKLPTWADPVAIAAAAAAAAEKRAATKAEKSAAAAATAPAAAAATAPAATAPAAAIIAPPAATAPAHDALAVHVNAVIAAARGGFLSAAQINQLRAALDTAAAAAASVPTKRRGGKVTAPAPAATAPAPAATAPAAAATAPAAAATAPAAAPF